MALSQDMQVVRGCLIAPVSNVLDDDALVEFKDAVLARVNADSIRRVLIDVSARHILDMVGFSLLVNCARMLSLQGAQVVFVGFQPGVASALLDLGADVDDLVCAGTVEDGFTLFRINEMVSDEDGIEIECDEEDHVDPDMELTAPGDQES